MEGACGGYLKGMVRYHTGSLQGHERECEVARSVFDEYLQYLANQKPSHTALGISLIDTTLLEKPLTYSRQLKIERNAHRPRLTHALSGKVVEVSTDMLELIDSFRNVTKPASLLERYHISNLSQIVHMLLRNHVLIPATMDEELEHLNQKYSASNKRNYETENCICLYSHKDRRPAENFTQLIQNLYSSLESKFKPLRQKMIIYVAENREELTHFWFEPFCPPWITGFVVLRRVLAIDLDKIRNDDWESVRFKAGMTHEIVHMLLSNHSICLPKWLEEGVCEYFSKPDPDQNLLNLMEQKKLLTFKELEAKAVHTLLDIDNSKTDDNICYHQAHSFVRYLCGAFGEDAVIRWIDSIGINLEISDKFYELFGKNLIEMEQTWFQQLLS